MKQTATQKALSSVKEFSLDNLRDDFNVSSSVKVDEETKEKLIEALKDASNNQLSSGTLATILTSEVKPRMKHRQVVRKTVQAINETALNGGTYPCVFIVKPNANDFKLVRCNSSEHAETLEGKSFKRASNS